jgi:AraC-like DNA-binding protein
VTDRRVLRTIEYLLVASKEPGQLADIAGRVGLSASRLTHLFKAQARTSIRAFIRERRLRRAAELIASTDERISQIGYAVGFSDPSNFNHAFKKSFGVSPKQFRELARDQAGPRRDAAHDSTESTNE